MTGIQQYIQQVRKYHWLNQSNQNDTKIPHIEVIVPVYNGHDSLIKCTKALLAHTSDHVQITFLNDASTDSHVTQHLDSLPKFHPNTTVIHRKSNLGYLHNINHHLKHCHHDVLLLNADTEVTENWLSEMLHVASDDRIGAVCPLSNNATLLSLHAANKTELNHLVQFSKQWYPIPTAVGFCMLIKKHVLEQLGGFDPYYHPGYGEECDYSMLIRKMGLQVACAPAAYVHHQGSQSFQKNASVLQRQHQTLLDLRYPKYQAEINTFQAANPVLFVEQTLKSYSQKKSRILHVVHGTDNKGGVELFTKELISQLKHEFHHTLLIPQRSQKPSQIPIGIEGCDVIEISPVLAQPDHIIFNNSADPYHKKLDSYFINLLSSGRFDLVKFHSLVGVGTAIWPLLCHQLNTPYQLFFHDHYGLCQIYCLATTQNQQEVYCEKSSYDSSNQCIQCITNKTRQAKLTTHSLMELRTEIWQSNIEHANHLYFPSVYLQDLYQLKHPNAKNKSTVFSPNFYPSTQTEAKPINPTSITIAFLGQFGALKGAQLFIDLYHSLNSKGIKWQIIGGIDPKYKQQLDTTSIELTGSYISSELTELLEPVDLVVFTSQLPETYGITLTEALINGVPVIAPNLGVYPERINNTNNGLLYQPNQLDSLIQTVNQWLDTDHHSKDMISFTAESLDKVETMLKLQHQAIAAIKPIKTSFSSSTLLAPPPSDAYDDMQNWLDAPMTLEAEGDWQQAPDGITVVVVGENDDLCHITKENIKQHFKSPQIIRSVDIPLNWQPNQQDDALVFITEGSQLNENTGNWLSYFKQSGSNICLSDYALCNQNQQIYAPQFQARFSWQNFLHSRHHIGCVLIKIQYATEKNWVNHLKSPGDFINLIIDLYQNNPNHIAYFPHFTHTVRDVLWVEQWKRIKDTNNKTKTPNTDQLNPRVLIYVESNQPSKHFTHTLSKQSICRQNKATCVIFSSSDKYKTLTETDHSEFDVVILLNDNCYFSKPEYLQNICELLLKSTLSALSPSMPNGQAKQLMIGKKWGAQNHFSGVGFIKNTALDGPNSVTETDLLDDDLMVFEINAWQTIYQKVASNIDYFLPLKLHFWLTKINLYSGLCQIDGFIKRNLPSSGLNPSIAPLAEQRKQLINQRHHLPKNNLYSAAYNCRLGYGLDTRVCAFKTPKHLPRVVAYAHDQWASGFYRVKSPLSALAANNQISTLFLPDGATNHTATPHEINRLQPDALLLHHHYSDQQLSALVQYRKQLNLTIVLGADDLLTHIPKYNVSSQKIPKDVKTRIKLACSLADTLVVSTAYLAEEFKPLHNNIKIIPNRLSKTIWQGLKPSTINGTKLRVGWAGAAQHQADLAFLEPVIKATEAFCDWVFFGDKPDNIDPNTIEFHQPVDLIKYPAKLNSLALDLAVAPLVDNPFNRAKTNLKLLEYGALGLPVIASSINCYIDSPANVLPNDSVLWINELKKFHENRAMIKQQGDLMKAWVDENHWLEDHLDQWLNALNLSQLKDPTSPVIE